MSEENKKLWGRTLIDAFDIKIQKMEKLNENIEIPPPSRRHKIRMNRLFRERVGGSFIPFPEADNKYERIRSKIVIKLKINEIADRRRQGQYLRKKQKDEGG